MMKSVKQVCACFLITVLIWCGGLLSDRHQLSSELIRLHVVANSDSEEDQLIKLQVRDAVLNSIQSELQNLTDTKAARKYIRNMLPVIRETANSVLEKAGVDAQAVVTFCKESFDIRHYDTFTLPAGVYDSIRIVIGEGNGHNWWCVAFPAVCVPETKEIFEEEAEAAGFSKSVRSTLTGGECKIRFFLLDKLGELENIFFEG